MLIIIIYVIYIISWIINKIINLNNNSFKPNNIDNIDNDIDHGICISAPLKKISHVCISFFVETN